MALLNFACEIRCSSEAEAGSQCNQLVHGYMEKHPKLSDHFDVGGCTPQCQSTFL